MTADASDNVKFGYCKEEHRWFLFKGDTMDACEAEENKLAYSSKIVEFDMSISFGETWSSVSGSPLDLYVRSSFFVPE